MTKGAAMDKMKGRVKEAIGALTGDEELKRKGRADQTAANVKEKAEDAVDKAKNIVTGDRDRDS